MPQAAVGYLFAEEVTAAIDRYSREVADAVVEKAQKLCTLYIKVRSGYDGSHGRFSSAIAAGRSISRPDPAWWFCCRTRTWTRVTTR